MSITLHALRRAAVLPLLLALAGPLSAQDTMAPFALELNAAQTESGACRMTYVATNRTETALSRAAYEFAVFDMQGVVTRLLVLEFGPLVAGKTKVLQFDLTDMPCEEMSRIVVNGAPACLDDADAPTDICMSGLETASRAAIQFGL